MVATSLITLIGAVIYFTAASGSGIQSLNTCSCLGQTVSFECVVTGGTLTVWSGTAFSCQSGEISLRHGRFMDAVGSCNNGAIIGRGVTSEGNQYTSRLDVTMSNDLVGKTVTCSVDDNLIGSMTLAINNTNIFSPPSKIDVISIGPDELIFSWEAVPPDGCPSFEYGTSATNCGTCTTSLTTSNMSRSTCTNFTREIYPKTRRCIFGVLSTICTNINGRVSSPIHINLTVPGRPYVQSVPYYNYRTAFLDEIQTSITLNGSFKISDNPDTDGSAVSYTITYADTTTGTTCYSDTVMTASCEDMICKHIFDVSLSFCRPKTNITINVFATNILGNGQNSTPTVNIGGVNTFVSVTFNTSTRIVLCHFLKASKTDSIKQCNVNVSYGASCDQQVEIYPGSGTTLLIASPPLKFDFNDGVSEYCLSVNATSDNETVIVEEILNLFGALSTSNNNNNGYVAGVTFAVLVILIGSITVTVVIIVLMIGFTRRGHYRNSSAHFQVTPAQVQDQFNRVYFDIRKEDLQKLKQSSRQPYAHDFVPDLSMKEFHSRYMHMYSDTKSVKLVGRISLKGKQTGLSDSEIVFIIKDVEGRKVEITANEQNTDMDAFEMLKNNIINKGDIVGVNGFPKQSDDGKLCLVLKTVVLISPCLHLINNPETLHFRTTDKEKYKPRYFDLIMNDGVDLANKFIVRTKMITFIRKFLDEREFLEVETPIRNNVSGGATSKPISTHHSGLNQDVYLRVATELYHKMLVVGGFERVYEIGKQFSDNKKIDRSHNPEFTTCEFCWAYTDYIKQMTFTEDMISEMVKILTGENKIEYHYDDNDREKMYKVDFKTPFRRIRIIPKLKECLNMMSDFPLSDESEFRNTLDRICVSNKIKCPKPRTTVKLLKKLIKHFIVEQCINPTFIMDYPQILCPLNKRHPEDEGLTESFVLIICKEEICDAYTDLRDPEKLRDMLAQRKKAGEQLKIDESYSKALEYGLPPTVRWRMGIDRMAMLLTDSISIKEVMLFPAFKSDEKKTVALPKQIKKMFKSADSDTEETPV